MSHLSSSQTASWANDDPQGTEQTLDFKLRGGRVPGQLTQIAVRNPSTVTALTVKVYIAEDFSGNGTDIDYIYLTEFAVPVEAGGGEGKYAVNVSGWITEYGGRLVLSNDTVLGAADAFDADVTVRRV